MLNADEALAEIIKREEEGQHVASLALEKEVVLVMGNTGVGKSTFMNYLLGCVMKKVKASELGLPPGLKKTVIAVDPDSPTPEIMKIGHGNESATSVPKIAVDPTEPNRMFCDCPGFFDNRGSEVNIGNSINIRQILRSANTVKIIFLLDYGELKVGRGSGLNNLESMCTQVFGRLKNLERHQYSILLGITNVPWNEDEHITFADVKSVIDNERNKAAQILSNHMFFYDPLDRASDNECFLEKDDILQLIRSRVGIPKCLHSFLFQTVLTDQDQTFVQNIIREKTTDFTANIEQCAYETAGANWKALRSLKVIQNPKVERDIHELAKEKLVSSVERHVSACMEKVYDYKFDEAEDDMNQLKVFIGAFPDEGLELHIVQLEQSITSCKEARDAEIRAQNEKMFLAARKETEERLKHLKEQEARLREELKSKNFFHVVLGGICATGAGFAGFFAGGPAAAVQWFTDVARDWGI